jgi:alpha-tubulin suppressor-like RCC1 family protein
MKNLSIVKQLQFLLLFFSVSLSWLPTAEAKQSNTINRAGNVYRNEYQRVSCGYNSTFEIRGGTLWAWGSNFTGQLGDGTNNDHESPVQIGNDNTWHSIAGGTSHTLAIKADGSLWAWGDNTYGELGNGTNTSSLVPIQIPGTWSFVSANGTFSMGLKSDGSLWAWGYNAYGQLGDGTNTDKNSPVQIAGTWAAVATGAFHSMALKADGSLWTWGDNSDGQLGNGNNSSVNYPISLAGLWTSVSAGAYHSIALKADGSLWSWGRNTYGQLGVGNNTNSNVPLQITGTWTNLAAGSDYSMGLKANGELWTWGYNTHGELGDGSNTHRNAPVHISGTWVSISAGAGQTIGQKADGTLWAWGKNDYGQFGIGNWNNSNVPVQTSVQLHEWIKVASAELHTLGLKSNGELWAWGYNYHGELGDGTNADSHVPVLISGSWMNISVGEYHSLGIKTDGTLWAWGDNTYGQLGNGTNVNANTPMQIGTDNNWVSITAGEGHSMALKDDGTIWSWGRNYYGEVGDNSTSNRSTPVQLSGTWINIVAGSYHSLAIKQDGTLWAWGSNAYHGQLGNGTNTDYHYPVQSGTDNTWLDLTAGYGNSLGLKANGTIWAWGFNAYGQLGDNSYTDENSPQQVGVDNNWISVSGGDAHCMGLKDNGNLWAWGYNGLGNLGDGSGTDRLAPVPILNQANIIQLHQSTNAYHSAIIGSTRDKVCLTGHNDKGQLGDGTTTNRVLYNCITNCVPVTPTISVSANPNDTICSGTTVMFTASITNGGNAPSYQWYLNGNTAGSNQSTYSSATFNDSDVINCVLTSNYGCVTQATATSNSDTIRWNAPNATLAGATGTTEANKVYVDGNTTVSYTDCDLMATVTPSGVAPLIDTVTVKVTIDNTVDNYNGQPYVQRHYDIERFLVDGNPTATIKLYAYQSEFDAYNTAAAAASLPPLPVGGIDNGNVRITQFHGVGTAPGNYPGPEVLITPAVSWDAVKGWWVMTFDVTGFSGFYIHSAWGQGPLAIKLANIAAVNYGMRNRIDWTTSGEVSGDVFTLERSADGSYFSPIANVAAKGNAGAYTYWDEAPYAGINYYRVKLIETSKQVSYSRIVQASVKGSGASIAVYPNPVSNKVRVNVNGVQSGAGTLSITDLMGRELIKIPVNGNKMDVDISGLPDGLYLLRYTDDAGSQVIKIEKA